MWSDVANQCTGWQKFAVVGRDRSLSYKLAVWQKDAQRNSIPQQQNLAAEICPDVKSQIFRQRQLTTWRWCRRWRWQSSRRWGDFLWWRRIFLRRRWWRRHGTSNRRRLHSARLRVFPAVSFTFRQWANAAYTIGAGWEVAWILFCKRRQ